MSTVIPRRGLVLSGSGVSAERIVRRDGYDVLGYRLSAGGAPSSTHAAVRRLLRGFGPVDVGLGLDLPRYEVAPYDGIWHVTVDDAVVHAGADFAAAMGVLEWEVVAAALGRREDLFHLHGAALCVPTRPAGLVLVAESGKGKTTLALALMLHGFAAFGDDVALIDPNTLALQGLRRAFHIERHTWPLLEPFTSGPIRGEADGLERYFTPPQWAERPVPLEWLLFIDFDLHTPPRLTRLSASDAAEAILAHSLSLARSPRLALSTCARLTSTVACYRFTTGDLAQSVALVRQLVAT